VKTVRTRVTCMTVATVGLIVTLNLVITGNMWVAPGVGLASLLLFIYAGW
jgi:hypothetical protein